jgi:hypothetical protein
MRVRLVLLMLLLSSSGASVLPARLASPGPAAFDPAIPVDAGRLDLFVRANGEIVLHRDSPRRWRVP